MSIEEIGTQLGVEERLSSEGIYVTKTRGFSMRPLFKTHRDAVVITPPTRPLRKLDIVLYTYNGNEYILHRIIGFDGEICLIRGDNTFVTERVPKSKILGVVASFNRKGKRYDLTEPSYRIYSSFWTAVYPVRRLLYNTRRTLSKIKHKILGRKA